jgi:hypothetical protein
LYFAKDAFSSIHLPGYVWVVLQDANISQKKSKLYVFDMDDLRLSEEFPGGGKWMDRLSALRGVAALANALAQLASDGPASMGHIDCKLLQLKPDLIQFRQQQLYPPYMCQQFLELPSLHFSL